MGEGSGTFFSNEPHILLDVDTTIALYISEIKLWDNNLELDNTCDNGGKNNYPAEVPCDYIMFRALILEEALSQTGFKMLFKS